MTFTYTSYSSPVYVSSDETMIDCVLTIPPGVLDFLPDGGDIPFTASKNDTAPHGREIHAEIVANATTIPIAPYVPPTPLPSSGPLPTEIM